MRYRNRAIGMMAAMLAAAATLSAQTPANDATARLKQVLPPDVAARVLAIIAQAHAHDLPGDGLENRALKFAAKGVDGRSIERAIAEQETRMEQVRDTLQRTRGHKPAGDEIEAGAEALRKGVDGAKVAALARSAPSGRSLAVPLYVVGSLVDRGLPSDSALQRVAERLKARASDRDLENLPNELPAEAAEHGRPAETGRALGEARHPGSSPGAGAGGNAAGGPPAGVPANGGAKARPTAPGIGKRPVTPPGKKP